jgi:hypothetical protein
MRPAGREFVNVSGTRRESSKGRWSGDLGCPSRAAPKCIQRSIVASGLLLCQLLIEQNLNALPLGIRLGIAQEVAKMPDVLSSDEAIH